MNRCSDFIMTEGGQRVGHHLHRITPIGQPVDHCDPCHGNCVVCVQAQERAGRSRVFRDEPIQAGFLRTLFAKAVLIVGLAAALVIGCTLFKQPKPAPELPRATAKVTT